ncbi:SDR family oxidoreductase [Ammoniphilus sp. CFH 90114]|uniref:SDR family oxidoreductase n=1 Tax=Ammoniphilus sp. CFH 90114 TaxID=2493665 RepID=UPI00100F7697|nr:SDR family oxidoreductase [Ammoniphilus sp. CFH 90114]RXT04549.1 SDR family oxidoreductase [Ammoniphilus sp. CFH 90114]
MNGVLYGKTVLITGGTRGLGKSISTLLAKEGASVLVTSRNAEPTLWKTPVKSGEIQDLHLDVTNEEEVKQVFEHLASVQGRLDILINNAGVGIFKSIEETTLTEWNEVIQTNLTGVFLCSREAFKTMKKQNGGRIINISSVAGYLPIPENGAYGSSKFGVRGLSAILNEEGKPYNIRVSIVSPGAIQTDMSKDRTSFCSEDMLQPEDVAETVLDISKRPLHVRIDEVKILPPKGIL